MKYLNIRISMPCILIVLAIGIGLFASTAIAEDPYEIAWARQLGMTGAEVSYSVAVDAAGNAFISGDTQNDLGGTNAGGRDAYLAKYDPDGNLLWTEQLGTSAVDQSYSVAVDATGNAYISGLTGGSLDGTNVGGWDAFLAKYDTDGNLLWIEQLGTTTTDRSKSVAVDATGNVYIAGRTSGNLGGTNAGNGDAFLAKYDSDGNILWIEQFGTSGSDWALSVAVDAAGNAFITGYTNGSLGGTNAGSDDAFLVKYDSDGTLLWTEQLGTSDGDWSKSVAVDADGNAFITGGTEGSLGGTSAGGGDAFLAKYDPDGTLLWVEQLGTSALDRSSSIAVDVAGNVFISGYTDGSLGGTNAGQRDAFLARYDPDGILLWIEQFGTTSDDRSLSMALDTADSAFITGLTSGNLGGTNAGNRDAFLVKFTAPELTLVITVDIKPTSCPNPLNIKSSGVLPVAILGSNDVDVNEIIKASILLVGVDAIHYSFEDVAGPASGTDDCNCTTDGPDGFLDLTLKFETQRIVEAMGQIDQISDGETWLLELTGMMLDERPIAGADCVIIRGKAKPR